MKMPEDCELPWPVVLIKSPQVYASINMEHLTAVTPSGWS